MFKWIENGNYMECHVGGDCYFCTNEDGRGLFRVNSTRNERKQILGTAEFSVCGLKDKRRKMRAVINELSMELEKEVLTW